MPHLNTVYKYFCQTKPMKVKQYLLVDISLYKKSPEFSIKKLKSTTNVFSEGPNISISAQIILIKN